MTINDLIADGLARNEGMVKMLLADFTDAEMLVRPAPNANHAAWQLGHVINSETNILNLVKPGAAAPLPAGWSDRYAKDKAGSDDPGAFVSKAELLAQFEKTRAASVAWARSLKPDELDQPTPERIRRLAPRVGDLGVFLPIHTTIHLGQVSVIRRKLGKPVLF